MSAAQTPIDRSFAIATGAERSTTAPITIILFIIDHSPKKKDANALTHLASVRPDQPGSVWWTIKTGHSIDICQRRRAVVTVNARYALGKLHDPEHDTTSYRD
jgi:hypothetical protein